MASSAGACSRTKRNGCRHGAIWCASTIGSKRAGEIRGGRFVAGISGEQFALPEAIASLRNLRQRAPNGTWVCLCGADPLNLVGSVLAGDKVTRVVGSRVLYRDGVPVGKRVAGETVLLEAMDAPTEQAVRSKLLHGPERGYVDRIENRADDGAGTEDGDGDGIDEHRADAPEDVQASP